MPCILSRKMHTVPILHDAELYKKRHKIELSLACRKCRRRLATHHDRCVEFFLSVICIAAIVYGFVMGPDPKLCLHNCFRTLCSNTVFWFTVLNTVFAMSAQCAVAHSVAHHKNKHLSHCF